MKVAVPAQLCVGTVWPDVEVALLFRENVS